MGDAWREFRREMLRAGVGDREGAVRLRVDEIVAVLEEAAEVLTAGT